jgi:hypothetical protein
VPLRFNQLLIDENIDPAQVRLLRHQTGKVAGRTPYTLWRDEPEAFDRYQTTQDSAQRARFAGSYWASFIVPPDGGTMFVGLYEVSVIGPVPDGTEDPLSRMPVGHPAPASKYDLYDCVKCAALSPYVGRLHIHWGDSPSSSRAWVQRADNQNKEIVELTPNFQEPDFPGFTLFSRALSEIDAMPPSWKAVLLANRGVYLLACPRTREHYVGSAYGADGFLSRWRSYASTGHGGNVGLQIRNPSDYVVSILEVAGSAATAEDVLRMESVWKQKLLSRYIGLNLN